MAALTGVRNTDKLGQETVVSLWKVPVKANVKIWAGAMTVIDAGYLAPAYVATTLISAGRARATFDNTGGSAGAIIGESERGSFFYDNSPAGADFIAQANVGAYCYFVDDHTVALTSGSGTRSQAGRIMQISEITGQIAVQLLP